MPFKCLCLSFLAKSMVRSFSDSNFVVVFIYFCFCSFYWLNAFVVLGIMKQGFDAFYFVFFCFSCFLWQKINWQEYSLDFFLSDISSCIRESSQVILLSTISIKSSFFFFFYPVFLSWPFTNHRTAREGGGHFFNSSLPLPPTSRTLRH